MQNGPYGITSKANIFMAAYSSILQLHLELELLDKSQDASCQELLAVMKGN